MDVDAMNQDPFDPVSLFDISSNGFPWRDSIAREIEARRALMSDVLLFDLVLRGGGIRHTDILYPPTDVQSLRALLKAIEDSNYDILKQECLVYFLLKWHNDGRDQVYKVKKCLPEQFVALSDAYWYLDTGLDVPRAISLLSDARLVRDFTSKVLEAISITTNSDPLILRYMRAAQPRLTEPNDIDTYTIALANSSLLEAWQYQRTFPEGGETRSRLICNILKWCLSPKPRAKPLSKLLGFSITPYEQSLLHAYALRPPADIPSSSIPVLQHLVIVRLIQAGQYAPAVKLDHQFSLAVPSSHPSSQGHSFTPSMIDQVRKGANNRKAMIQEIIDVIPRVEKELLELELEKMSANASSSSSSAHSSSFGDLSGSGLSFGSGLGSSGLDTSMSMSWESVRGSGAKDSPSASFVKVPKPNGADSPNASFGLANKKVSPQKQGAGVDQESDSPMRRSRLSDAQVAPIPLRSGAPRFGGPIPSVQSSPSAVNGGGISAVLRAARGIPQFTVSPGTSQAQTQNALSSPNGRGQGERKSLFETVGSANRTRNAFYEPPSSQPQSASANASATSAGVKRPFGAVSGISARARRGMDVGVEDLSSASAGAVVRELLDEEAKSDEEVEMDDVDEPNAQNGKTTTRDSGPKDVDMGMDEEVPSISAKSKGKGKAKARQSPEGKDEDQPQSRSRTGSDEHSREYHISIFSPSPPVESPPRYVIAEPLSPMGGLSKSPGRVRAGGKLARSPSDMDVFPGAFIHDETESQVNFGSGRHHHLSPPPPLPATPIAKPRRSEAASKKPATKSKTGAVKKERKKARTSFPGALITDDEEDEDELSHSAVESEDELLLKSPSKQSTRTSHRTRRGAARSSELLSDVEVRQGRDLDDESEDVVMPLPPVTPARRQPARKSRTSTGTTPRKESSTTARKSSRRESVPTKANAETTRVTRRSSRLSNAGSESPEPPSLSPVKRRTGGSTRASAGSGGGAGISAGVSGGVSKKREGKKGKS